MRIHRLVIMAALAFCIALPGVAFAKDAGQSPALGLREAVSTPVSDPRIVDFVRWKKKHGGNNHWYAIIASEMYWEDAKALAESIKYRGKYGYLATITSPEENAFIFEHVIAGTNQPSILDMFWLGGQYVDGVWGWTTGEAFAFVNWAPTEPNNMGIETVIGMWGHNTTDPRRTPGKWNNSLPNDDVNTLAKVWSVVEWGRLDDGDVPPPEPYVHLTQWRLADGGNDHWYAVVPRELYWVEADALAGTLMHDGVPAHLATITSAEENAFILNHVVAGTNQPSILDLFWLGGREVAGVWQWLTGEPFGYANWAGGEPNNPGIETSLALVGWNDDDWRRAPGEWLDVLPDNTVNSLHRWWAVIEWPTGFAAKPLATDGLVPAAFSLEQNFPNPFNPATEIQFTLPESRNVRLQVINVAGQVVATLVDGRRAAGDHSVIWNGMNEAGAAVASGVYFYRIAAGDFVQTKRMTLLR